MNEDLKRHLPTIAIVSVIGVLACAFALSQVLASAERMSVDDFSLAVFVVPCIAMVLCSFLIVATSEAIGRQLFLVVVGICLVAGLASLVVTSGWFSEPDVAAKLLANSGEGAAVTPPLDNAITVIRDVAAFVVAPTVGCIAGAWLGSRLHPMRRSA